MGSRQLADHSKAAKGLAVGSGQNLASRKRRVTDGRGLLQNSDVQLTDISITNRCDQLLL